VGFKANSDEYKVMGLAPYSRITGENNPFYSRIRAFSIKDEMVVSD